MHLEAEAIATKRAAAARALCAAVMLALTAWPCAAQTAPASEVPTSRARPPATMFRLTGRALAAVVCHSGEKTCTSGQFIMWCCPADRQCGSGYPGACK